MKKLFLSVLALLMLAGSAIGEKLYFTFNFDNPTLNKTADSYTEIQFASCMNLGEEGYPSMPLYGAKILLPQNQEIVSIKIVSSDYTSFITGIKVKPAERYFPISKIDKNYKVIPNDSIYNSNQPYPNNIIGETNTQFLSGHSVGLFTICPVIYIPADNKVKFLKEVTIEVKTKTTQIATAASAFLRKTPDVTKRVSKLVHNPAALMSYSCPKTTLGEYDILLISNYALLPYFNNYVTFKTSTGYAVKTISVEDIYTQYIGQDNQEKIRNCIIDCYQNKGIAYVILGGDADPVTFDDIIPHRGLYSEGENDIPSDEYYSCLDGNWDNNGNGIWGEPGEFDLLAEVSIGRICVDNSTEISNATNKLIMYQDNPVISDIVKTLMIGENLGWSVWGSNYMEEIANGSSNNGYTTAGILNQIVNKLYETTSYTISPTDIYNQFNNVGVNLLNHLGHANEDYNMKIYNTDITSSNFQNNGITRGFVIGYSQGCFSGSFDNKSAGGNYMADDCFAEKITTFTTGEVADIANSRYGWGNIYNTDGPSQHFHRQYIDAIFGEEITNIGDANRDSKDDNAVYSDISGIIRWCDYEITLFGDPTMDIWTAMPTPINAVYQQTFVIGAGQIPVQTDAPNARIGLVQSGVLIGRAITDASGNANVNLDSSISFVDTIYVSITAHNRIRHKGFINVIFPNGPFVEKISYIINDTVSGNSDGLLDYGEHVTLSLTVKNIGIAVSDSTTVFLSTNDPYVTITDTTEFYGDILAGSSAVVTDGFALEVSDSIPDNHYALFKVRATNGDTNWVSNMIVNIKAPVLSVGNMAISDVTGNNNGGLDPGETADIIITTNNTGHSDALNTIAALSSVSSYITINNASYNLNTLNAGSNATATFNVTLSSSTPIAGIIDFNYNVSSGFYHEQKNFITLVGLVVEDWESGGFTNLSWTTNNGDMPWTITNSGQFEGMYCAKSGVISDNQTSTLKLIYTNVPADDSISFYRKVSSEQGFDVLKFYIDNIIIGSWSGEKDWARVSYPIIAGNHTFTWVYSKDWSDSDSSDCAWIDYIRLPPRKKAPEDASLVSVLSPVTGVVLTNAEVVKVNILNNGNSAFANFPVSYSINGGAPVTEIVADTVNPGNFYTYTFATAADISVFGTYNFTAYTSLAGDTVNINDTTYSVVKNQPCCIPTSNCNAGDVFTQFNLNTLIHTDNDGCLGNGYADYTSMSTDLVQGYIYNLDISVGCGHEYFSLWIDFNDNHIFEPTELMIADFYILNSGTLYTDTLNIPAGANLGAHRMRARIHYVSSSADPCITFDYGETHDYTVIITVIIGTNENANNAGISIYPNPSDGKVNLSVEGIKDNLNIRLYNVQGQLVYYENIANISSAYLKQLDFSDHQKGIYYLEVKNNDVVITEKMVIY